MAVHKPKHADYYIIEVEVDDGAPPLDYVRLNQANDEEYAKLLEKEKNKELKATHPTMIPRAALLQTPEMVMEEYYDEETYTNKKRFKEILIEADTDNKGRIWVLKGKEKIARDIIRTQRALGRRVSLDDSGLLLPEEMPEDQRNAPVNRGGRPPKK